MSFEELSFAKMSANHWHHIMIWNDQSVSGPFYNFEEVGPIFVH